MVIIMIQLNPSHIGVLVEDIDRAMEFYTQKFGVDSWQYFGELQEEAEYYGKPHKLCYKAAMASFDTMQLELIQPTAEGSNLLLKQMQGALVLSPEDVLEAMGVKADKKQKESVQLGFYEMQILEILEQGETHFEELMEKTGLNANDLQNVVFNMEMNDLIDRTSGNYFTLK